MKVKVTKQIEVNAVYLRASCGVRYWEDSIVNGVEDEDGKLIPCKVGDRWKPLIELETGTILNWEQGVKAEIHYKVVDDGQYYLLDENKDEIIMKDGYVPHIMSPKENGYGDYVIMDVDENGVIANWKVDLSTFDVELA